MPETYYLIIPGSVWGDHRLDTFSKLLYGEVACKCNLKGYCWATNEALAETMGCTPRTIQRSLAALKQCEHVVIEIIKDGEGTKRQVWLREGYVAKDRPPGQTKKSPPHEKGVPDGHDKKVAQNILSTDYSNANNLNQGGVRASEHEGVAWPWETETFWEAWAKWREYKLAQHKFRYKLLASEQAALNWLKRLADDSEATAHAIMRQSMAQGWKGLFSLNKDDHESNRGTTAGGGKKTGASDARIDALRKW